MLDRTGERFDLKPKRLAADTAYGTGKFVGWLVKQKKIIPHIPVWAKSDRQDGIFSRSDFHRDGRRGIYICPAGKRLQTSGTIHDGRTLLYRASKLDCDACPIRAKCCTTAQARNNQPSRTLTDCCPASRTDRCDPTLFSDELVPGRAEYPI